MIRAVCPRAAVLVAVALAATLAAAGCGTKKARPAARAIDAAAAAPVDAAPPPPIDAPHPPSVVEPTGAPTCDRYQAVLIAALACDALAANRAVLQENLDTLQRNFAAWPRLPAAERKAALTTGGEQCKRAVDGLLPVLAGAGCPPP